MIRTLVAGISLVLTSFPAIASIDCTRPIQAVWSGFDEARVYVVYRDGFANAAMTLPEVANDERFATRTLAVILSGHLTGRSVTFRYSRGSDGSAPSCTPAVTQSLIGAWVN